MAGRGRGAAGILRRFWKITKPFWFSSEEKFQAFFRLFIILAINGTEIGVGVLSSYMAKDLLNSLNDRNPKQFRKTLLFIFVISVVNTPVTVMKSYCQRQLSLMWRSWLTRHYVSAYLSNKSYYIIQSECLIDNPDQRIVDDISSLTGTSLSLFLDTVSSLAIIVPYATILHNIYPKLLIAAIVWAIVGSTISIFFGKVLRLVGLNFSQEKKEADFRFGMVRLRENVEAIAFYGGENEEMKVLAERFTAAFKNLRKIFVCERNLGFYTEEYKHLVNLFPQAILAPLYFSGNITLGSITQSHTAFNNVLTAFSFIVYKYESIASLAAIVNRLAQFDEIVQEAPPCPYHSYSSDDSKLLVVQNVTLEVPRIGKIIIKNLSFDIFVGKNLLVTL